MVICVATWFVAPRFSALKFASRTLFYQHGKSRPDSNELNFCLEQALSLGGRQKIVLRPIGDDWTVLHN